jgi:hypothetical protein
MSSYITRFASHGQHQAQKRCLSNVALLHIAHCSRQQSVLTALVIGSRKFHAHSSRRFQASAPRGRQRQLASEAPATLRIHLRNAVPAASQCQALPCNVASYTELHDPETVARVARSQCTRKQWMHQGGIAARGGTTAAHRRAVISVCSGIAFKMAHAPWTGFSSCRQCKTVVTEKCQLPSGTPAGHAGGCGRRCEHCEASQRRAASAMAAKGAAMGRLMLCQPGADMFKVQGAARLLPAHELLLAAQPLLLRQVVPQLHQRLRQ